MEFYSVYVLKSKKDNKFYTGFTNNLNKFLILLDDQLLIIQTF